MRNSFFKVGLTVATITRIEMMLHNMIVRYKICMSLEARSTLALILVMLSSLQRQSHNCYTIQFTDK